MTRITASSARLVVIPVETERSDAIQAFLAQETPFVEITTDDGLVGRGYSYTIGTGGAAVMALLREVLLPQLVGLDSRRIEHVWSTLHASTRATTPGTLTSLALAAIDTALWDIAAQRSQQSLALAAGGHRESTPAYDTEHGWLHIPIDELVDGMASIARAGWTAGKVKVGKPTLGEDMERLTAVREAVGDEFTLMVDANQGFTRSEALRRARAFQSLGVAWLEEPLPSDDLEGHVMLARQTSIPIAVGETLTTIGQCAAYLTSGAASIMQVDVARVGGITPWLKVAHLAEALNVAICPHFLMELHVSLAAAVPAGTWVEHIPQLREVTTTEVRVEAGRAYAPEAPGLGIAWDMDKLEELTVA